MIEELLITLAGNAAGGFCGTLLYFYVWCPNHGCCQHRRLKKCLEGDDDV
ncbi:hypothetical protein [uncultured Methanoregula sp.]|nr:hypothetical protein [uncultured Methanoregula sp.]